MTKHTRLTRRGAVCQFRWRIPADLVEHYGKQEITESLRTKDPTTALRLVRSRSLKQEEEFDRIRAARGVNELTDDMINDLAVQWRTHELGGDEEGRLDGIYMSPVPTPPGQQPRTVLEEDIENLQALEHGLRKALARDDLKLVEVAPDEVLQYAGVKHIPKTSDSYRKLSLRLLKEGIRLLADLQARNRGDVVDTPPEVAPKVALKVPPKSPTGPTLSALLVRWERERQPSPRASRLRRLP